MSRAGVLHVITGLDTGGAELTLLRLLEADATLRRAQVVSLRDHGTIGPRITALGVPVTALGMLGSIPTPRAFLALRYQARKASPAIVQGWMYHGNLAAMAARRAVAGDVPVVWNIRHSVYSLANEKPLTALVIRLGALLSRQAARIIYNSRTAAAQHEALGYATERTLVLPNGFDTCRFVSNPAARRELRAELGLPDETELIGLVGRYHPMKDHTTFLRAAARVATTRREVRFVLAGPQVDQGNTELGALIGDLGLADRVHLLGEVRDTPRLMAALEVLCSSSFSEGFPNVLGEAMACEIPCVATDVGDSAWLLGDTGVVVPPRDPEALAAGMSTLLALTPEERRALGAKARARIEASFALHSVARRYSALYSDLVSGRKPE